MPRLHDYILSPEAYTVRLMLALLAKPYERVAVDAYPGNAPVPVFEDGDVRLEDPGLILTWIARGTPWMPEEAAPEISHWLAFATIELVALNQARAVATLGAQGDLDTLRARCRTALRNLEDHLTLQTLSDIPFVTGPTPTIADIALFPSVALSHDCGIGLEDYPALHLWQRRIRQLPRFLGMPGIPDYF